VFGALQHCVKSLAQLLAWLKQWRVHTLQVLVESQPGSVQLAAQLKVEVQQLTSMQDCMCLTMQACQGMQTDTELAQQESL
jgi:hypothetical protein